jgi:hypothetical protein
VGVNVLEEQRAEQRFFLVAHGEEVIVPRQVLGDRIHDRLAGDPIERVCCVNLQDHEVRVVPVLLESTARPMHHAIGTHLGPRSILADSFEKPFDFGR